MHRAVVPPSLPSWPPKSPHHEHQLEALGAPAVRIMRSRPRGGSSIIEFAGAAPRRPKTCPNATWNACAFRSHSPANFEFPRPCRRPRRGSHHEHQRGPCDAAEEGRRQWRASLKGFAFSFAKLRRPGGKEGGGESTRKSQLWCIRKSQAKPGFGSERAGRRGSIRKSPVHIRKSPVRIRAETVSIKKSREHKGRDPQQKKKYHARFCEPDILKRWILGRLSALHSKQGKR